MKKKKILLLSLGVVMMAACSSDDSASGPQNTTMLEAGKTYHLSVNATKMMGTRDLEVNDATHEINAKWATNERIYVRYGDSWFNGSLSPNVSAVTAWLNGDVTPTTDVPSYDADNLVLQFPRQEINYTGQIGTLSDIAPKYDYATVMLENAIVEENSIRAATQGVTFTNQQAIVKFTLYNNSGLLQADNFRVSTSDLATLSDRTGDIVVTPGAATSEFFVALRGLTDLGENATGINAQVTLTAQVGNDTYVYTRDNVRFVNGQYYDIAVTMQKVTYGINLSDATTNHIGSVVGSDGKVYAKASDVPSGYVPAAMIAYVGNEYGEDIHGLAIALTDESGTMNQGAAFTTASGHTPTAGGSWRLPSRKDWQYMFIGCGNGETYSTSPSPNINYTCFNAKLATIGADYAFSSGTKYWSSSANYHYLSFGERKVDMTQTDPISEGLSSFKVRACLYW